MSSWIARSWLPGTRTDDAFDLPLDAEALERRPDGDEILGDDVLDHDLALGHRREADEARDLDVVGADAPFAAAEAIRHRGSWRTFEPIPSISAPSVTRNRHRSWTCGSLAALPITVSPGRAPPP